MPPYQGGGDMISSVTFERTTYNDAAVQVRGGHAQHRRRRRASRAALDYVTGVGLDRIAAHEHELLDYGTALLSRVPGLRADRHRARQGRACSSFVMDGVHPHDIGTILDREGVAIRTGHHCASR